MGVQLFLTSADRMKVTVPEELTIEYVTSGGNPGEFFVVKRILPIQNWSFTICQIHHSVIAIPIFNNLDQFILFLS